MQASSYTDKVSPKHKVSDDAWFPTYTRSTSESVGTTEEEEDPLSQWYRAAADGDMDLIKIAARAGQLDMVGFLIDKGANIEATDNESLTALHLAVKSGNINLADLLLQRGAQIDARTKAGDTVLHIAAKFNHSKLTISLVKHGAYIDGRNNEGNTPIHVAIIQGNADLLRLLMDSSKTLRTTNVEELELCYLATDAGRIDVVKAALEKEVAALLIENGIDIDGRNNNAETALHIAVNYDFLEMAELLIDYGIDVHAKQYNAGLTAFHVAIHRTHTTTIYALLSRNSDVDYVNIRDGERRTLLHDASIFRDTTMVKLLLDGGANINALDIHGETPLSETILEAKNNVWHRSYLKDCSFIEVVTLLIEAGADISNITITEALENMYPALSTIWINANNNKNSRNREALSMLPEATDEIKDQNIILKEFGCKASGKYQSEFLIR
ncbi:unnamed protein product [Umbelopsis ramanniana]